MLDDVVEKLARQSHRYHFFLELRYQRWFAKRIVEQHHSHQAGLPEAEIETLSIETIAATKQFVTNIQVPEPGPNETNYARARRWRKNVARIEAVYGLVGNDLSVLGSPNRLTRDVERRVRAVDRMFYEVGANPSPQARGDRRNAFVNGWVRAFEYPVGFAQRPPPNTVAETLFGVENKLNAQADQYWTSPALGRYVLRNTVADVREAIDALFVPYDDYYKRNWLYCQQVIMILHMDALDELGDANLYATLRARGGNYLRIGDPSDQAFGIPDAKLTITGQSNGTYALTIDGTSLAFSATGNTITEIRDGLADAIKGGDLPLHVEPVGNNALAVISHYRGAVQHIAAASPANGHELSIKTGAFELFLTTETDPQFRYFRQGVWAPDALAVGDHIYMLNHPVYPQLTAEGAWAGEHALVVAGMGQDVSFQGHGVPVRSLKGLREEMYKTLLFELKGARKVVNEFWLSPYERNLDGSRGALKPPKPDGTSGDQNGLTERLSYGGHQGNIHRDTTLEANLEPRVAYASWNIPYTVPGGEVPVYLFNQDGTDWIPDLTVIPGLRPGIGGMTPKQVWVIRPDQP